MGLHDLLRGDKFYFFIFYPSFCPLSEKEFLTDWVCCGCEYFSLSTFGNFGQGINSRFYSSHVLFAVSRFSKAVFDFVLPKTEENRGEQEEA
jgi:hypothetical protein